MIKQLSLAELEAGMTNVLQSPPDGGAVQMIVARPAITERVLLQAGEFTLTDGLVGDNWLSRGSGRTEDGQADPDAQVTLMNGRYLDLIANGDPERMVLAGDQLIVDLDLSMENLPTGQQLRIGEVLFKVTALPHTGCVKFKERFGLETSRFTGKNKELRLRGIYVKVVEPGTIRPGDAIRKV